MKVYMEAKPLSKAEAKWIKDIEKLFLVCPSSRIGLYSAGDACLFVYDKVVSEEWLNSNKIPRDGIDMSDLNAKAGSKLGIISTGIQIDVGM